MSINVGDRLSISRITEQFHCVCNDGFFGVRVSSTSSGRYGFSEPLKAGVGFVLDDLVHAIHYETVREVPSQQWCSEQELLTVVTADEHATRRRHDVVLFGVLPHERTYVVARHRRVLEDRLHLGKVILQMFRDANVAFDHAEQRTVDNCCDDLLLRHLPFWTSRWSEETLHIRFFAYLFPLTLPHLDYVNVPSKVGCLLLCVFQKFGHRFTVQRIRLLWLVAIRATMEVTSMKLIRRSCFRTPPIDG